MATYQIWVDASINRQSNTNNQYSTSTANQHTVLIEAANSLQAENIARSMFGGHQNCNIVGVQQKY